MYLWKDLTFLAFFKKKNYFIWPFNSSLVARAFSIDIIASPDRRSWLICTTQVGLISFSFENERSADATVTGNVRKIRNAEQTSAKFEDMH